MKTEFKEKQKYTQWWLWLIFGLIYISPLLANLKSLLNNGLSGTFGLGILGHFITLGLIFLLIFLLRLDTEIDTKEIRIHYFPFLKKRFGWDEITQVEPVRCKFTDVGGWGIRYGTKFGMVYNVKGYDGFHFKLKNGKQYMIGTQKIDEIREVIKRHSVSTISEK